jgi:hypothetical protein
MLKRVAAFISITSLFILPISASPAKAMDQCLAEFPDSAWTNTSPSNLRLSKDLLLTNVSYKFTNLNGKVFSKSTDYSPASSQYRIYDLKINDWIIDKISLNYQVNENSKVDFKYTYSGANCSTRSINVSVPFPLIRINPIVMVNDSDFSIELEKLYFPAGYSGIEKKLNFLQKPYLKKGINDFIKLISDSKVNPLDPNALLNNGNFGAYTQLYSLYASQGIDIRDGLFVNQPVELSLNSCMLSGDQRPGSERSHVISGDATIYFDSINKTCKTHVYFKNSDQKWLFLGEIYYKNPRYKSFSKSEKSIKCMKGKSIKEVSGNNSKCPKGFKKVA